MTNVLAQELIDGISHFLIRCLLLDLVFLDLVVFSIRITLQQVQTSLKVGSLTVFSGPASFTAEVMGLTLLVITPSIVSGEL